jgi:hypothetical protein
MAGGVYDFQNFEEKQLKMAYKMCLNSMLLKKGFDQKYTVPDDFFSQEVKASTWFVMLFFVFWITGSHI